MHLPLNSLINLLAWGFHYLDSLNLFSVHADNAFIIMYNSDMVSQ